MSAGGGIGGYRIEERLPAPPGRIRRAYDKRLTHAEKRHLNYRVLYAIRRNIITPREAAEIVLADQITKHGDLRRIRL